jgi:UDP-N-acetylmuramoyl-L-alanyl-D-glutamate--2,6-diaminopimelate ligase
VPTVAKLLAAANLTVPDGIDSEASVSLVTDDSRQVTSGAIFIAVPGSKVDGRRFIAQAVEKGAALIVTEPSPELAMDTLVVPVALAEDVRRVMALMAHAFHGWPARGLQTIGVTGTNGKTTMTYLIEGVLHAAGNEVGVIGTIESRLGERQWPAPVTTPGAIALAGLIAEMRADGAGALVMEVSSHAIDQQRVAGISFDAGVFTNVTQDHLDYHGSMENYAAVKRRFFTDIVAAPPGGRAIVNIDDSVGVAIAEVFEGPVVTYGRRAGANIRIREERFAPDGTHMDLTVLGEPWSLRTPLLGPGTGMNVAALTAWAQSAGFSRDAIQQGLAAVSAVPGRFERVDEGQPFLVLVDYSHTPAALEGALQRCAELKGEEGRVIVAFGCGGDRDRLKRAIMGEAAGRGAELVWLTSDNPRTEDPAAIAAMAEEGLRRSGHSDESITVRLDRRRAIEGALASAREGDVVLIAGKGHETYQEIGTERFPFDDRDVARQWLLERGGR